MLFMTEHLLESPYKLLHTIMSLQKPRDNHKYNIYLTIHYIPHTNLKEIVQIPTFLISVIATLNPGTFVILGQSLQIFLLNETVRWPSLPHGVLVVSSCAFNGG